MQLRHRHICGLDSLRFICALWVAMHHGARPEIAAWLGLSDRAIAWNSAAFDGVAAVIVFFVISGLCIHYPYARSEPCHLPAYFAQRYLRVGIPFVVIVVFVEFCSELVGVDIVRAARIVLWSLWCELIYYALYPALLVGFRKIGLVAIIVTAFLVSYALILARWDKLFYWDFYKEFAWLTALPAWLLGCAIAQTIAAGRLPLLPGSIWGWRIMAILLSIPPKALIMPSISPIMIGNPFTLDLFAVFVFFWLTKEIASFDYHPPPAVLEWGGRWSYSIYLVHNIVIATFVHLHWPFNQIARWILQLAAILAVSYGFYQAIELPAHRLARSVARHLNDRVVVGRGVPLRP